MDFVSDQSHRTWIKIADKYDVPDYVLESGALTKEATGGFENSLFADTWSRLFPVESDSSTWLSAAYFKENSGHLKQAERDYIELTIREAAAIHDIEDDVVKVLDHKEAEVAPPEDDDSNYCWLVKDASGAVAERNYPVFDAAGVEKANEYFERYRGRYPLGVRRTIALNLVKKAHQYGVDVSDTVMREAGFGVPHRAALMNEILERAKLVKESRDHDAALIFANLNEMIASATPEELTGSLDKIAENIDAVDRLTGINRFYGDKIMPPADIVFGIPIKQASAVLDDAVTLNRMTFSITKLAELGPDFLDVLGDDFISAISTEEKLDVEKLAAILPTLPRSDKIILEGHILENCE
jgi:hypothetical protein